MNDVQAYNCTKDETAIYLYKLKEIMFDFSKKVVVLNEQAVALLDIDYEYEDLNGCIMISAFEVFQKGIGLGTAIISRLLEMNKGKKFCLYSEPAVEKFWESLGFVKGDDGTGTEIYYYGLEQIKIYGVK